MTGAQLALQQKIARVLLAHGIGAEITFCGTDMVAVQVDDATQFEQAKAVMDLVRNVTLLGEARDDECGHTAFYTF
jgi:hypothetical protein